MSKKQNNSDFFAGDEEKAENVNDAELAEASQYSKAFLQKFMKRSADSLQRSFAKHGVDWYGVAEKALNVFTRNTKITVTELCKELGVSTAGMTTNINVPLLKGAALKARLKHENEVKNATTKQKPRVKTSSKRGRKKELTLKEHAFVIEFVRDSDAYNASLRAGYKNKNIGYELLKRPDINAAIDEHRAKIIKSGEVINVHEVIARAKAEADLDINEICTVEVGNCEYCNGENHEKQWRDAAHYQAACEKAEREEKPIPSDAGGYGYKVTNPPHPECPRCRGKGIEVVKIKPTKEMSDVAKRSIVAIEQTKHGIKITTTKESSKRFIERVTESYIAKNHTREDNEERLRLLRLQVQALESELAGDEDGEKAVVVNNAIELNPLAQKRQKVTSDEIDAAQVVELDEEAMRREIDKGIDE